MKPNHKSTNWLRRTGIFTLAATILALAGCATGGYVKSEAAATSLQIAAGELQDESQALKVTVTSLDDLVNRPPTDLKFQYEGFSSNLNHLIRSARRNETVLHRVGEKNAAYFASWDKYLSSMNYEAVRARSQERKTEVTANFDSVYRRYQETQATVQPLLDYFQDIRKALSTDLTLGGLEAMKATISKVSDNSAKVQSALAKLSEDLAATGTQMSAVIVQNRQP